jgi:inner membrane transporter RhtA
VLGGICSVQIGAAVATHLFHRIGPGGTAFLRLLAASIVLCVIWRPRIAGRTRRELGLVALFGAVLAGMNLTFYHAIDRIPLGVAVTIEFIGPLAVAVLGSRRRLDLVWAALALVGIIALLGGNTHGLNALGVCLAALAGLLWGAYIVVNARLGQAFSDASGLALAMAVGTVLAFPDGLAEAGSRLVTPHALLVGAAVGMLSSAIPYTFEHEALRRIATNVFGVLMSLEPGVAALAGFIVIGQSLGLRELVGIALVISASLGASRAAITAPIDA